MKYIVIGDEDTVLGFGMVGIPGYTVSSAEEAERAFKETLENRNVGIVIITERTAELIRPLVDHYLFTEEFPLILEIPDRAGKVEGKLTLKEMVNAAIGINV